MLIVETISKIRRLAHVQGKTIKAICRELGVSHKVVRKVLRSEEGTFYFKLQHANKFMWLAMEEIGCRIATHRSLWRNVAGYLS